MWPERGWQGGRVQPMPERPCPCLGREGCTREEAERAPAVFPTHPLPAASASRTRGHAALGTPSAEQLPLVRDLVGITPLLCPCGAAPYLQKGEGICTLGATLHPFSPLSRFAHQCPLPCGVNSEKPHLHSNIQITYGRAVDVSIQFQGSLL